MTNSTIYHVNQNHPLASDNNEGTENSPLLTINRAAELAFPGDTVLVHKGVYRERIIPQRSGEEGKPIEFKTIPGEKVFVKGSDLWEGQWIKVNAGQNIYKGTIPKLNENLFNPFIEKLLTVPDKLTLGQIFVNGMPIVEVDREEQLKMANGTWMVKDGTELIVHFPATIDEPSNAIIEVTMRDRLFAPSKRGLGYIHVNGFIFEHCANQFPNAFWDQEGWPQAGAVSCRSGHHWVIENNVIRYAKAIGLDCGSEGGRDLEGDQRIPEGVGYHIIKNNVVSDNGACGITGWKHTRTKIIGNIVERNNCHGFLGAEEAGIKFHYFIEGVIEGNVVRDNDGHGIWLDNVWTGARVTKNVCINNFNSGIFMELGEGPCLVDNNILAFSRSGDGIYMHDASGVTVAHNLFFCNSHFGLFNRIVTDRPYEKSPGVLQPAKCSDHQILNNLFIDNYRGHISMPIPSERAKGNRSDYNLFINGSQWNWEGLAFHSFHLNKGNGEELTNNDTAEKFKYILDKNNISEVERPNLSLWKESPFLTEDWWKLWTNNDEHSNFVSTESGELINGFVEKGSIIFSPQEMYIHIQNSQLITRMTCPQIDGIEYDFYGKQKDREKVFPGPFQHYNKGFTRHVFWQIQNN